MAKIAPVILELKMTKESKVLLGKIVKAAGRLEKILRAYKKGLKRGWLNSKDIRKLEKNN